MSERDPMDAQAATAPESSDASNDDLHDDDLDFKPQGPLRRNAGLLIAVAAVLIVGPAISRVIGTYRAIVLDVVDGDMFVAEAEVPPRWISDIGVEPGQIIEKVAGSWNPQAAESNVTDKKLLDMFTRWMDTYEGVIVEIIPPAAPGRASIAIIKADDGRQFDLPLWAEHMAASRKGRRVGKEARHWDPVLLPDSAGPSPPPGQPGPAQPTPAPETPEAP